MSLFTEQKITPVLYILGNILVGYIVTVIL